MTTLSPPTPRGTTLSPSRRQPSGITPELVFIGRSLRHSLRDAESLLMAVLLPTILMLLFTFVFGGAIEPGGGYVDYVAPGIILLCAGFGSASTAVSVANDMRTGIIERFRTMPLRSGAVLTGHVVASLLRNLLATGIVIALALLLGFRPSATFWGWIGALGIIALYILAITYLFAAIGLAASGPEAASAYGFIILFVPYLSSAFVPVDTMPSWLQWIAQNQPITPIIETIRSLLDGTSPWPSAGWALFWCLAVLAVSSVWGAWLFRRRARRR